MGRATYHATIREGVWKDEQIIDSKSILTCEVLSSRKKSRVNMDERLVVLRGNMKLPGSVDIEFVKGVLQYLWF